MSRIPALCIAALMAVGSTQVLADARSHAADAERFLPVSYTHLTLPTKA